MKKWLETGGMIGKATKERIAQANGNWNWVLFSFFYRTGNGGREEIIAYHHPSSNIIISSFVFVSQTHFLF